MLITYFLGRGRQRPEDKKQITELIDRVSKMKEK
jgi:hypothetical protein